MRHYIIGKKCLFSGWLLSHKLTVGEGDNNDVRGMIVLPDTSVLTKVNTCKVNHT